MGGLKQSQWTPTKRRGPIAAEFSGPGPAAVALPTLVGKCIVFKESFYLDAYYNYTAYTYIFISDNIHNTLIQIYFITEIKLRISSQYYNIGTV